MRKNATFRNRLSVVVPLTLTVALVTWGVWHNGSAARSRVTSMPDVQFGSALRAAALSDLSGSRVTIKPGHGYLLLFVNPQADAELLKYLAYVADSSVLSSSFQPIVFVSPEYATETMHLLGSDSRPYPCVDVSRNAAALRAFLGVPRTIRKVVLLDKTLRVAFVADFFKKADLRELMDRWVGSRWSRYASESARSPLSVGDRMPSIRVKNLRSGESFSDLPHAITSWIVLTSRCTSCTLANTLAELQEMVLSDGNRSHVALLFSRYFPESAIVPRLSVLGLQQIQAFIATSELDGLEDPYLQQSLGPDSAMDVEVDNAGTIGAVQRFDVFVAHHAKAQ